MKYKQIRSKNLKTEYKIKFKIDFEFHTYSNTITPRKQVGLCYNLKVILPSHLLVPWETDRTWTI